MGSEETEGRRPLARVVVADDEQSVAEMFGRLAREGYGVEVVHDGVSAVEAVREYKPTTSRSSTSTCPG